MEFVSNTRYTVVRQLSAGGMGHVYEAEQLGDGGFRKRVAIKTIRSHLCSQPEFVSMFIGEARLVADLVHPNIAQLYHFGRSGETYYIAMELIEGIDLSRFIARHRETGRSLPWEMATFIVSRVSRALEYAHSRTDSSGRPLGIVHRDISPRNIMISCEGEVKLLDFGVAKASWHLGAEEGTVALGKACYMSPEQASFRVTDRRSDLYSLGAVFFELLTGHRLFDGDTPESTAARVREARVPSVLELRGDLPGRLVAVLERCLQPDATRRYPNAGSLGYDLEYLIYGQGYGPTIVSLASYLRELFPEQGFRSGEPDFSQADTIFYGNSAAGSQ